jgi:acetyl esterase/lipase
MQSNLPRPPYDEELGRTLAVLKFPAVITPELIPAIRARPTLGPDEIISGQAISHEERSIKGPGGNIPISIFRSTASTSTNQPQPGILWFHGGGYFSGNRFGGVPNLLSFVKDLEAVIISVEYRLAPEHPDPGALEDCYTALDWVGQNLMELGINQSKLMIAGSSAGGGLAAGVALYARDHGGPTICAQLLQCPMIDDRLETLSTHQYINEGTFSRGSSKTAWDALLGARRGGKEVSIYAAPARAKDLSGLPPAFIEVGSAEGFRDENVAYASLLWASGVQAELHVWPGAYHRFQAFAPAAALTVIADKTREDWVKRILSSS